MLTDSAINRTQRLLRDAREGVVSSLGQLLESHRDFVTLHCRLQIGTRLQRKVDPSDLVQDIFLDAHRQFPRFEGETYPAFFLWFKQIITGHLARLIRHYYGTGKRNILLEQSLESDLSASFSRMEEQLALSETSPSGKVSHAETLLAVAHAIESLPADYRDVIILRQMEVLPFAKIAERLNKSVDAVQKLWVRALDQLRKQLAYE